MKTADISDQLHPDVYYVDGVYQHYGAQQDFCGEIVTIKCFEDNSLVREMVQKTGKNKVLVIDAGGSKRCAMLGDKLAKFACQNGWSGILLYGMIRDSKDINSMPIAIRALGTMPLKSIKKGVGEQNITVSFSGAVFTPGHYLYADEDGIIVINKKMEGI